MPCFNPRSVYCHPEPNPVNGKKVIFFSPPNPTALIPMKLPCGQCSGCRLERSRQWAVRVMHEAQLYDENLFVTLTYNDECLPEYGDLEHSDFQKFMKRLRRHRDYHLTKEHRELGLSPPTKEEKEIRYYMCGEYGENFGRPHFHVCLFNVSLPDKKLWRNIRGNKLYRSQTLEKLWPYGFSSIGSLTFESAAYVARYIMKKRTGSQADEHYEFLDPYGEYRLHPPEYNRMSLKPGIGSGWFEKYSSDVYPRDEVIIREKKCRPPKYYDKLYELSYPSDLEEIKYNRFLKAKAHQENNTPERLAVREQVQLKKLDQLKRTLK